MACLISLRVFSCIRCEIPLGRTFLVNEKGEVRLTLSLSDSILNFKQQVILYNICVIWNACHADYNNVDKKYDSDIY
jgi:hypothetical protein